MSSSNEPGEPNPPASDGSLPAWKLQPKHVVVSALSLCLAAALIVFLIPVVVGTGWSEAFAVMHNLSWWDVAAMTGLWALGLWLYTFVYTASLPGLTHSKALSLNLTGSLVSNVLPFGGAAGVATTYGLTYWWGFRPGATSLMILVSGLANVVIRVVLPLVGMVALVLTGGTVVGISTAVLIPPMVVLLLVAAVLIAVMISHRCARAVGAAADWLFSVIPLVRDSRVGHRDWTATAVALQVQAAMVLRRGWWKIAFGMAAYYASEIAFFGIAIHSLGSDIGWVQIIAAFALSRVLTSVVVTPSGVGISEAGTAALLLAFGVDPAVAAASVVILNFYTYLIEIPAGVLGWAWVGAMRRRWHRPQSTA